MRSRGGGITALSVCAITDGYCACVDTLSGHFVDKAADYLAFFVILVDIKPIQLYFCAIRVDLLAALWPCRCER